MKKILALFLLASFLPNFTFAQNKVKNIGIPYIRNYSPEEYKATEQNWVINQDQRGIIYIGNSQGLLEFDGYNWRSVELPDNSAVRSICVSQNNMVFVGGKNEFGYVIADSVGQTTYKSISSLLPEKERDFGDIWKIYSVGQLLYFQSFSTIFLYNGSSIKTIPIENKFCLSFEVHGKIYVRERKKGLQILENDKLKMVPDGELFATQGIFMMLPYDKSRILIGTRTQGLYLYDGQQITALKTPIDSFFVGNQIYCGVKIGADYYAIGTNLSGIVIIDKTGKPMQYLDTENGLQNNTVWNLFLDREKNLWAALDIGVSYVETNSPFTYFGEKYGVDAKCYTSLLFDNKLFIGGAPYIYTCEWLAYENPFERKPFQKMEATAQQSWLLKAINGELFCAHNPDVLWLQKNKTETIQINNKVVWTVTAVKNNKNLMLAGQNDGIYVLQFENNQWKFRNKIGGFDESAQFIEADNQNNYWVTFSDEPLNKIRFNDNFDSVIFRKTYQIRAGFPFPMCFMGDSIIATSTNGFYIYDAPKDSFVGFDSFNNLIIKDRPVYITGKDNKNNIWFADAQGSGVLLKQHDGSYKSLKVPFLKLDTLGSVYPVLTISDSSVIFGQSKGFAHFDPTFTKDYSLQFQSLIRKVQLIENDSLIYGGTENRDSTNLPSNFLEYKNNSLRFIFAATFFENIQRTEYQYKLDGFDKNWSQWTLEAKKEYTNIQEGNYTFRVRAKNVFGTLSNEAVFTFSVQPPWYRSWWAYTIYVIAVMCFMYVIVKLNTRRLVKEKQHLEQIVTARTTEIIKQKDEILHKSDILEQQKKEITEQNVELNQQKEEIQTQAERIYEYSKEMEKLSLVASKTDNTVTIFDAKGNIEWVNDSFVKLYGYDLEAFTEKFGKNILEVNSNSEIKNQFLNCYKDKKSFSYESTITNASGQVLWFQTNITPILDENKEISKLIAIETDFTLIKEAQQKIIKQSEEIAVQRDNLQILNEQINSQNEKINSSIKYAHTIQIATLPVKQQIDKLFQSFLLYRPKDIVSGDFYWLSHLESENKILIAVVDCTGHGVPGAFMSMISSRLLSNIVNEKHITNPSQILETLNREIRLALKQDQSDNNDGMDVCLCCIERNLHSDEIKIDYAGAKRPLYYYSRKTQEMNSLRGNSRAIGGKIQPRFNNPFITQQIVLNQNDMLYLSSDGYIDQCSPTRIKFGPKHFQEIAIQCIDLPLEEQQTFFERELEKHADKEPQRDDITVLAIKL